MADPSRSTITPPRLSSLPRQLAQLERSSRASVFLRDGDRLLRAWGPVGRPFALAIEQVGDRWSVEAWGADPPVARRAVRDLFSLDAPLDRFYRQVRGETVLAGTPRRFRGLRVPRDPNLYESLVHAIVGQQLSVAAAGAITGRLIQQHGSRLPAGRDEVPVVPPPSVVLRAGTPGLRATGLSRAKAAALLELARRAPHLPSAPALRAQTLERARATLDALPGVGRWSAENALLRGAGRPDVFVGGDLGVRAALERFGGIARTEPEVAARQWADRHYPGWGSYATLYLWRRLVEDRAASAG